MSSSSPSRISLLLSNPRRIIFLTLAFVLIIVILAVSIHSCGNDDSIEYKFQKITKGEVVRTVFVSGKVNFLSVYFVKSEVPSGIVATVHGVLNAMVRKNELLATITSDDTYFNAKQTKEQLIQASLGLDAAKDVYEQKKLLFESKLVAQKEVEDAKRNYDRALSNLRYCQNSMDRLKSDMAGCIVRAPVAGMISQVSAFPQMNVGKGTDLFQIVDNIKKMSLELNISETDIGNIKEGKPIEFSVNSYPDKKFTGKITVINATPVTENNIVIYKAYADCDNSQQLLKSGMTATASIFIDRVDNVLRIPNEAFSATPLFADIIPGKKFVWGKGNTSDPKDMKKIEIKTGLIGSDFTQLTAGNLKENDQVLVQVRKKTKGQSIPGL